MVNQILKDMDYFLLTKREALLYNVALCTKYPWLVPKDVPEYDYTWSMLDGMPIGWRKAFGMEMCEEIQQVYETLPPEVKKEFCILDLKEKFGELVIYFYPVVDEIEKISRKYEKLSTTVCQFCGAPATNVSQGWIGYWCDAHARKDSKPLK